MGHIDKNSDDMMTLEAYADRLWESAETHTLSDAAFEALTDLIVDCSSTGRIINSNQAFANFSGLTAQALKGRDSHEFAFFQNRDLARCTVELKAADGSQKWFDRVQLSMRDQNTGNHFIRIIGRDVTKHKQSELALIDARKRAEDADLAKSRFLAMISHEIRTPLNGIIGMGNLLSDTTLSAEQDNYVDAIKTSGEALLVLVNDLLQFGKQELSEDNLKNEPTALAPLLAGVMELLSEKAYAKKLDLGYTLAPDLPEKVLIDAGRLRQILFNIIGNAVKFTEQGGVRVDVSHFDNGTLGIKVMDTGQGIADDLQEKIFEPFKQVEDTFTRTHDGAGLGLAIAKRMANAMGGDIILQSLLGEGSTFEITLKAEQVSTINPQHTIEAPILIVSAGGIETEILDFKICGMGGQTFHANNIEKAKKLVVENPHIRHVILDQRLSCDMQGWPEECRLIALIEPSQRGSIGAEFKSAGQAFLTRPVRPTSLRRILSAENLELSQAIKTNNTKQMSDGGKILLAEDNPINTLLATKLLQNAGYEVTAVTDGAQAVKALHKNHAFCAVLMDLHMPVMDGLSAIKAIRHNEEGAGGAEVPILLVTADSAQETQSKIMDAGASGILDKPLNIDALRQALAQQTENAA